MRIARQSSRDRIGQNVKMGEFNLERVNSFKYLGHVQTGRQLNNETCLGNKSSKTETRWTSTPAVE